MRDVVMDRWARNKSVTELSTGESDDV